MTSLPPQHTIASQTVVLPPLNGFQQGSIGTSPRTFRNGHGSGWSHIRIEPFFVLPYVGLTFRLLVMCLHAQHAPVRAIIISTEGRRGLERLHLALVCASGYGQYVATRNNRTFGVRLPPERWTVFFVFSCLIYRRPRSLRKAEDWFAFLFPK